MSEHPIQERWLIGQPAYVSAGPFSGNVGVVQEAADSHNGTIGRVAILHLAFLIDGEVSHVWLREEDCEPFVGKRAPNGRWLQLGDSSGSIEKLGLSVRSYNCLSRAGFTTAKRINEASDAELLYIRNFGARGVAEVRAILAGEPVPDIRRGPYVPKTHHRGDHYNNLNNAKCGSPAPPERLVDNWDQVTCLLCPAHRDE